MKISRYNNFILESQSEKSIEDICKKYNIKNYTINSDGSIDVDGNVSLIPPLTYHFTFKKLESMPLKFGKVSGHFN